MRAIVREMFGELSAWGKFWLYVGLGTLLAAALMSFDFGWGVSWKHALFLALLSVITAFAPEAAYRQWKMGKRGVTLAIAVICAPLFVVEFYSHAGYTAGLRGANIETATVQNARYDDGRAEVDSSRASLKMWTDRLARLEAEHAWAATVSADALRAQLDSAQKAVDIEAARGGCKSRCLALMKSRDDLKSRIALAEERADLTNKIEATKRVIGEKVGLAAKIEHKSSPVAHQNEFLAKLVALGVHQSLDPSAMVKMSAEQSVNLAMALAGTGLPAFALFIAGLYRIERRDGDGGAPTEGRSVAIEPTPTPVSAGLVVAAARGQDGDTRPVSPVDLAGPANRLHESGPAAVARTIERLVERARSGALGGPSMPGRVDAAA